MIKASFLSVLEGVEGKITLEKFFIVFGLTRHTLTLRELRKQRRGMWYLPEDSSAITGLEKLLTILEKEKKPS